MIELNPKFINATDIEPANIAMTMKSRYFLLKHLTLNLAIVLSRLRLPIIINYFINYSF